jgi:microcin C transport system substrate-binding protein
MDLKKTFILPCTAMLVVLAGCGKKSDTSDDAQSAEATNQKLEERIQDYYKTKWAIPTEIRHKVAAKEISSEELEQMKAEGKFKHYFEFKTIADLPQDLEWDDGMDLPDLGDPNAIKGGTYHEYLRDFPRTLRTVGPDANGGFRFFLHDSNEMLLAWPYPNSNEVTENGFRYYPGLADRWAVDRSTKTVYIHLNPKARWSDGYDITTKDVAFTLFFLQSKDINAPWYNDAYETYITGLTVYDDYTFAFHLPENKPDNLGKALEHVLYPRHFYNEFGKDYVQRYQWRVKPTAGAYTIDPKDIIKGRMITMSKVKDWWAKDLKYYRNRFNYDRIQFVVVRDPSKAFEMFMKGELDSFRMTTPEYNYDKLPDNHPLIESGYIHKGKSYNDIPRPTYGLYINCSRPYLNDVNVRRGIAYASNWDLVNKKFYRGDTVRMRTECDGFGVFTNPDVKAYPFDVDMALASFTKAGFTQRDSDGILTNDKGDRLSFTVTTGYAILQPILEILKEQALKAGLDLRLEILDSTASWKKVQEKKQDIQFTALGVGVEVYPRYWEMWSSDNAYKPDGSLKPQTNNICVYANPEMDELIRKYRASSDATEMVQLAHEMTQLLHDDSPFVPGFVIPFLREASWRWIRYPENGLNMRARYFIEFYDSWIDPNIKKETKEAMKKRIPLKKEYFEWDQYNTYK